MKGPPAAMRFLPSLLGFFACAAFGADVTLPSDVAVSLQAEPSSNLLTGQPIRLTITVANNGPSVLDDFGVDSANAYPDQVDQANPDIDCGHMVRSVVDGATTFWYVLTWYPTDTSPQTPRNSPLAVGESRSCHMTIRLMPTAPQTVQFDFHLATYWSDPDPSNNVGQVTLQRAAAVVAPVPIASTAANAGIALFLLLFGCVALATPGLLRTRRH